MGKKIVRSLIPERWLESRHYFYNIWPYEQYMMKHRCIFIHIPKTGGTSIRKFLGINEAARNHTGYKYFIKRNPLAYKNYFKFCIVRNPYHRTLSIYNYIINGGNKNEDFKLSQYIQTNYKTFDSFVLQYLNCEKINEITLLRPQYRFIYDPYDKLMVDYVCALENLEQDMEYIKKKLNIKKRLTKVNTTDATVDQKNMLYKPDIQRKILSLYRKDFMLFGYSEDI